jgi:mevalonate kinase
VTLKDCQSLIIFYNGALKRNEDPSPQAIASNADLKRFTDYLETLQNNHPELVTFDLAELKMMLKLECI